MKMKVINTCHWAFCGKSAIDKEKYCVEHLLQCQYCGSTDVFGQVNGPTLCYDWRCWDRMKAREKPFLPPIKKTGKFKLWLGKKLGWNGYGMG